MSLPEPPPDGVRRRTIALVAGGGLALLAVVALVAAALSADGDDPDRPAAIRETPAPVVPVTSDSPTTAGPGGSPSAAPPAASRTAARPSSPAPSSPAPTGPRVLSVTVTAEPGSYTGPCRSTLATRVTVKMQLSAAGTSVRYTVNDGKPVSRTVKGTTFGDSDLLVLTDPSPGQVRIRVAVSAPSTAAAETTFDNRCRP